jgi:hypothetical protein
VLTDVRLLVQDAEVTLGVANQKLARDGQADDPGADNDHVVAAHRFLR